MLGSRVGRVLASDQQYALKILQENINANRPKAKTRSKFSASKSVANNIEVVSLDWEEDDIPSFLRSQSLESAVDLIIVCDCVFNYALIQPLVQTCTEICRARSDTDEGTTKPTLCIIAQQLRQPDVFESWLKAFIATFRVWRLPDSMLSESLYASSGYAVHVGVLRRGVTSDDADTPSMSRAF